MHIKKCNELSMKCFEQEAMIDELENKIKSFLKENHYLPQESDRYQDNLNTIKKLQEDYLKISIELEITRAKFHQSQDYLTKIVNDYVKVTQKTQKYQNILNWIDGKKEKIK